MIHPCIILSHNKYTHTHICMLVCISNGQTKKIAPNGYKLQKYTKYESIITREAAEETK